MDDGVSRSFLEILLHQDDPYYNFFVLSYIIQLYVGGKYKKQLLILLSKAVASVLDKMFRRISSVAMF